ncbi:MAG: nuclear transport factor 2 family protein [Acidobacteriota bacterium]|nr:nuclear transport factor 2 family protein [Acidobacteriota bacterium]
MKNLFCLVVLLGFVSPALAQKANETSALESVVNTERAFARTSEEKGTREAFMEFIADDGILFRPTAVKGKQWMTEHPLPRSEKRDLLSWQPTFADIAGVGDMGYTTGPWQYKSDIHDAKPIAFGDFLTVWKKQADGSWKFAIDLGISNAQPDQPTGEWRPAKNYKRASPGRLINATSEASTLLARDRQFSTVSESSGAQKAFLLYASPEVRVFRNGKFPLIGEKTAATVLPSLGGSWTWVPAFADVSMSGDLGYTYGTYQLVTADSSPKVTETGNYFRIWKKSGKTWKVVADVADPVRAAKKN